MKDVLETRAIQNKTSTQNGFFRRNVIDYPNSSERRQKQIIKQVEEKAKAVQKPVSLAGFTKQDFQRIK